jgi:outer membrane protein assembly factor BamB
VVVSVQSVHDGGLNWYYATADGSLYMAEGPTESKWITGPIGIQAGPAVKEGIRKVWVGTAGGELITADALHGTVLRTASLGDGVFYLGCHGPNLIAQLENGTIIALDPQTETVRWTTGVNGQVLSAVETQDVLLLLLFSGPAAVALDANSGNRSGDG